MSEVVKTKKAEIDWSKIERLDPRASTRQLAILRKMTAEVENMLDHLSQESSMSNRTKALRAVIEYRKMMTSDPSVLIQELIAMPEEKLKILSARMKHNEIIEDFVKRKLSLGDIYDLPKKKEEAAKIKSKPAE